MPAMPLFGHPVGGPAVAVFLAAGVCGTRLHSKLGAKARVDVTLHRVDRTLAEETAYFDRLHQHHTELLALHSSSQSESGTQTEELAGMEEEVAAKAKAKASFELGLKDISNSQFVGRVHMGNPKQPFDVIWDTGSSNLWINGPRLALVFFFRFVLPRF